MFGLKSGKSAKISLPCLSRFGFSTDIVFAELVNGLANAANGGPLVLLSLTPVLHFFLEDPSFDANDDVLLGAIVNLSGDLRRKRSRNVEFKRKTEDVMKGFAVT